MKNTQKGSVNIWLIVLIIVLLVAVGYFAFIKKSVSIDQQQPQVNQTDDASVTSQPAASPSIMITSPKNGETYKIGDNLKINWNSSGLGMDINTAGIGINLIDQNGNTVRKISQGSPNSGSFSWIIQGDEVQGVVQPGKYRIGLYSTGEIVGVGNKSELFTISAQPKVSETTNSPVTQPVSVPSITIISPNGGEIWKMSESKSIKWTSSGLSNDAKVAIRLRSGTDFSDFCDPVDGEVSAKQGVFIFTPATTMCIGKTSSLPEDRFSLSPGNYKIEIGVTNYGGGRGIVDTSDKYFTITR